MQLQLIYQFFPTDILLSSTTVDSFFNLIISFADSLVVHCELFVYCNHCGRSDRSPWIGLFRSRQLFAFSPQWARDPLWLEINIGVSKTFSQWPRTAVVASSTSGGRDCNHARGLTALRLLAFCQFDNNLWYVKNLKSESFFAWTWRKRFPGCDDAFSVTEKCTEQNGSFA